MGRPRLAREEREIVEAIGMGMLLKLEKVRDRTDRPHWRDMTLPDIVEHLDEEVRELKEALTLGAGNVEEECVDVANVVAMILDVHKRRRSR